MAWPRASSATIRFPNGTMPCRPRGVLELNQELAEIKRLSRQELQAYDCAPLYIATATVNDWLAFL